MGKWVDIPAHRVYVVPRCDFPLDYELLNGDGRPCGYGEGYALARRKTDGRLFRAAPEFGEIVTLGSRHSDQVVLIET